MMQSNTELLPQFKARVAGALWWLCIISGMAGFVVGAPLIVANDANAGFGYVISSSVSLFLPATVQGIGQLAMILGVGELAFFWLLIWGAEPQPGATVRK